MTDKTPSLKIKEPPCPECGQPYIAKGSTVYAAIERILDEHSAWIARPSPEVTKAVAFAAVVAAHQIVDADRANHEAPLLAALKTIVEAGDCTVESIREGRAAIIAAEHGDPPCPASPRMTDSPTEQVERAFNRGGEEFLLAALEKIAAMPPRLMPSQLIDQFVEMRILAKQAIAYATTPRDCLGVEGMLFTHLFVGDPPHCAACGLAQDDYLGEAG